MGEPDGSTVYARWASHVVGNVYFHAIAVGSQSHYALRASNYNKLGSAASAGCIRMTVADAKWLYDYAAVGSSVKIEKGNKALALKKSLKSIRKNLVKDRKINLKGDLEIIAR